jgi:hypothetical protein
MNIIANSDTSFFGILLFIIGITLAVIIVILAILAPYYIWCIYRQGVHAKRAEDTRFKILNRMMIAMESINVKMGGE